MGAQSIRSADLEVDTQLEARLSLQTLPEDLKRLIISFIRRPADLRALCLVSKEIRQHATPCLYEEIKLRVGGNRDLRLPSMLRPSNPGLQHIRRVFLRLETWSKPETTQRDRAGSVSSFNDDADDVEMMEKSIVARFAQLSLRMLLEYLPKDILEDFLWCDWEPMSVENYCLLCKNQKKLKCLELGPLDEDLLPILDKDPTIIEGFENLITLYFNPDSVDKLQVASRLLRAYPKIKGICFDAAFERNRKETTPEDLYDTGTSLGLITRTLFADMLPFETCTPLSLKRLDLCKVDLRYPTESWIKVVEFPNLEVLQISKCIAVDILFTQLSKPQFRPSQLKDLRWRDKNETEVHCLEAFEGFLEGLSTLHTLELCLSYVDRLPKIECITCSKDTLINLSIECHNDDRYNVYNIDEMNRLCNECKDIRSLSIVFPRIPCYRPVSKQDDFQQWLDATLQLQHLVTLNIRRWPFSKDPLTGSRASAQAYLDIYEHDLQRLSQHVFECSDREAVKNGYGLGNRSQLTVIAWGCPGSSKRDYESHEDRYFLIQIPYVRGTVIGTSEQRRMFALRTTLRDAIYVEPELSVLLEAFGSCYEDEDGLVD